VWAQTDEELIAIYQDGWWGAAFDAHDADLMLSYVTDDFVYDPAAMQLLDDKEGLRVFMQGVFQASPDVHSVMQQVLASGNIVVGEGMWGGTFQNEWLGIPATGNSFQWPFIDIVEFEGDKIKRLNQYYDMATWMMQVGLMLPSELPPLEPSFELPDPEPTGLGPVEAAVEIFDRLNAFDMSLYAKMVHADGEFFFAPLGTSVDRRGLTGAVELFILGFPDLHQELVRTVDMGDGWVLVEYVATGTHDGPYFGIPATGMPVQIRVGELVRFNDDGLMTNFSLYYDTLTLLMQLGLVEPPTSILPTTWGQVKSLFE
jgi:steroid delta-isomerase-like uncharacterized protein